MDFGYRYSSERLKGRNDVKATDGFGSDGATSATTAMKLSAVDFGIMACLQREPRSPIARIAKGLRLPHSTVRHRLNRLIRHRVIEFSLVSNPLHFGFQIWAIIEIKTTPPRIREVARRLAEAPEVYFVAIMTGSYDINVSAVFRSNAELLDFVTRRISRIPGIVSTSTAMVLELLKRTGFTAPNNAPNSVGARKRRGDSKESVRRGRLSLVGVNQVLPSAGAAAAASASRAGTTRHRKRSAGRW